MTSNLYKKYNGLYECENLLPDYEDCIKFGSQISSWFSERIMNPNIICNFDKGECGNLFATK